MTSRPGSPQDPRVRLSKALSFFLRHGASEAGLPMADGACGPRGAR